MVLDSPSNKILQATNGPGCEGLYLVCTWAVHEYTKGAGGQGVRWGAVRQRSEKVGDLQQVGVREARRLVQRHLSL